MLTRYWSAFFLGILVLSAAAQEKPLPKVVLVGDSIRMGYAPFVAKLTRRQGDRHQSSPTARTVATFSGTSTNGSSTRRRTSFTSMPACTI